MRRAIGLVVLALCLPVMGDAQEGIRYYPSGASNYSLGPASPFIQYHPPISNFVTRGLFAYWNLNEESGTRDDAVGSADMAEVGSPTFTAGKRGNALDLSQAGTEYISSTNLALRQVLDGTGPWSAGGWFRFRSADAQADIFGCNTTAQPVVIYHNVSVLNCFNGDNVATVGAMSDGVWYHILMTYDGTTLRCYRNTVKTETASTRNATTGGSCSIGTYDGTGAGDESQGIFDEWGVWNVVLTDAEVSTLYNSGTGVFYN